MDRDGDNEQKQDEEEEDEEEEDDDENKEEDEDEDNGIEPWPIGQGEMVNTSAANVDTMVEDQPSLVPEQGQVMREHTPWPELPAPALWPHNLGPCRWPWFPETHPLSRLECLGLAMPERPRMIALTLRDSEALWNMSHGNVHQ